MNQVLREEKKFLINITEFRHKSHLLEQTLLQDGTSVEETVIVKDGKAEVILRHKESLTLMYLPLDVNWSIEETNSEGYTVSYQVNHGKQVQGTQVTGEGNSTVTYTNQPGFNYLQQEETVRHGIHWKGTPMKLIRFLVEIFKSQKMIKEM